MIEFQEYEERLKNLAFYPASGKKRLEGLIYCALGLTGESGEVADKIKKILRDDKLTSDSKISDEMKIELKKELGDVLWYVTRAAYEIDSSLSEVAQMNVDKLESRLERGALGGSGDNR